MSRFSLTELRNLVLTRQLAPSEAIESTLERIDSIDGSINAFVATRPESVDEARNAKGPLAGCPVAVKDMFVDAGRPPTMGSKVHARGLNGTAAVIDRLRAAGAIVVGYTNLHEWGVGMTSAITATGPVLNPWDPATISGGSSGGSAAALASGMVPAAIGTDAGGSIRAPAACCGVVGLKPTWGRVPTDGFAGRRSRIDHVGPMARTVDDVRALFTSLVDGPLETADPSALKLGLARPPFFDDADPVVLDALAEAFASLGEIVAGIKEVVVEGADRARDAVGPILLPHDAALVAQDLEQRPEDFHPVTRRMLSRGASFSEAERAEAEQIRQAVRSGWERVFTEVDVVVTPTIPALPPPIDSPRVVLPSGEIHADRAFLLSNSPMNLGGVPALSLPCGETKDGWSVNLTLTAAWGRDGVTLALGEALESALGARYANRVAPSTRESN